MFTFTCKKHLYISHYVPSNTSVFLIFFFTFVIHWKHFVSSPQEIIFKPIFLAISSQIQQYINTVKRKSFCLLLFDDTLLEVICIYLV